MKKLLLICTLIALFFCMPVFADEAVINDAACDVANDGNIEVSFSVETEKEDVVAVISAYDTDGRVICVKIVAVTDESITRKLGHYSEVSYASIVVLENAELLKPLCENEIVENHITNGETFIPVGSLFPAV